MASTVEQAAVTALATWLASALPGVTVRDSFPDDDAPLPERGVTILMVGQADDEWTTPRTESSQNIHDAIPAELEIETDDIIDTPSANAALNVIRARYVAHLADVTAHQVVDATNVLTAPAVADMSSVSQGSALANDLRAKLATHGALAGASAPHPTADVKNAPTAAAATNATTLRTLTINLAQKLAAHFVARRYLWFLGSRVQRIQMDIWTHYEGAREELLGAIEQVIRTGVTQPDGADVFEDYAPVALGVSVHLNDADWPDAYAVAEFDAPDRISGDVKANEWRASYEGQLDVPMLIWGQTARLARARLTTTLNGAAGPTQTVAWADNADGYTETITPE